jgi:hypothetical protein
VRRYGQEHFGCTYKSALRGRKAWSRAGLVESRSDARAARVTLNSRLTSIGMASAAVIGRMSQKGTLRDCSLTWP